MFERRRVARLSALIALSVALIGATQAAKFPVAAFRATDSEGNVIQLGFDSTGTITVLVNGENFARSSYTVRGEELEIKEIFSPADYSCGAIVGKYKWRVDKDQLIFALVEDPCEARSRPITSLAWTKVPEGQVRSPRSDVRVGQSR